jgi:hypothetical protein
MRLDEVEMGPTDEEAIVELTPSEVVVNVEVLDPTLVVEEVDRGVLVDFRVDVEMVVDLGGLQSSHPFGFVLTSMAEVIGGGRRAIVLVTVVVKSKIVGP